MPEFPDINAVPCRKKHTPEHTLREGAPFGTLADFSIVPDAPMWCPRDYENF